MAADRSGRAVAGFDSASAMVRVLAANLRGREAPMMGALPQAVEPLVDTAFRAIEAAPAWLTERAYAISGALDAVPQDVVADVRSDRLAQWVVRQYPRRRYPVVFIGSSNGALLHLAAALGAPWLPQTLLLGVRHGKRDPDDARADLRAMSPAAEALLERNRDLQLHHMHDPCQDRLMIERMSYFRVKWFRLPLPYRAFLTDCLAPGGALVLVDCELRWPTTRVGDRHLFQFGAPGGATVEEFHGAVHSERGSCDQGTKSDRVADFLQQRGSRLRRWDPPAPDGESPEAEWGFAVDLAEDVDDLVGSLGRSRDVRLHRLRFAAPEDPSPLVADLFREWYADIGLPGNRLLVSSFALTDPRSAVGTAAVPYWALFGTSASADRLNTYLDRSRPYDYIGLTVFPHGIESIGLAPVERWRSIAARARHRGELLGVNPAHYPRHFRALSGFHRDLRGSVRVPVLSMEWSWARRHLAAHGADAGVRFS